MVAGHGARVVGQGPHCVVVRQGSVPVLIKEKSHQYVNKNNNCLILPLVKPIYLQKKFKLPTQSTLLTNKGLIEN